MMNTNNFITGKAKSQFHAKWHNKEGVFETDYGKYIVRVLRHGGGGYTTLSQHSSKDEALTAYDAWQNK